MFQSYPKRNSTWRPNAERLSIIEHMNKVQKESRIELTYRPQVITRYMGIIAHNA